MGNVVCLSVVINCAIFAFGCQKSEKNQTTNTNVSPTVKETVSALPTNKIIKIDVPKMANKSANEFDKVFGKAAETKTIENGGEYRLYKLPNYQKGLAVRFFGGKAKSFNLILDKPAANSKDAIKQNSGIDVENSVFVEDAKEPLSEGFKGTFGNVKFSKVSAKRQENGKGFIFVLAEIK